MTDEVAEPRATPAAKSPSAQIKQAPAEKIVVVILAHEAGKRGSLARLLATDAQKLIASGSARAATKDDIALAYPHFLPGD